MKPRDLDLTGYTRLPGFINAHDHLEFNLFPALGRGGYRNATEWARDIYRPDAAPVREHLRVPKPVRLWWGALKNLLSGVTTVCHHNPYEAEVFGPEFPVRVVRRVAWAHSQAFDPRPDEAIRKAPRTWPFVVHCAEGVDAAAGREVAGLDEAGALDSRTAIVHGVALRRASIELLRLRGASLVWCPTSNLSMFGRTVPRSVFAAGVPVALATDSALSAPVDLLDEMAVARRYVPAARVREMVTSVPARILRLSPRVLERDWIAMRGESEVALVVVNGRIKLISPELAAQLPKSERRRFERLHVECRPPVLVAAPVARLRRAAEKHLGSDLRLAGKQVLA
ncbi:MAG TPA: amidohydrolase family protein [Candidatus Limnocylindrales bacterium]|nr:amidohydrolase family protein [Candidatus Limnocylindrales bacterium]